MISIDGQASRAHERSGGTPLAAAVQRLSIGLKADGLWLIRIAFRPSQPARLQQLVTAAAPRRMTRRC
jgi:hypothetical protein